MVQDAQVMRALGVGCDMGFVLSQPVYFVRAQYGTCQIREAASHIPLMLDRGESAGFTAQATAVRTSIQSFPAIARRPVLSTFTLPVCMRETGWRQTADQMGLRK